MKFMYYFTDDNHLAMKRVARDVASVKESDIDGLVIGFVPGERGEGKHSNLIEVDHNGRGGLQGTVCGENGAAVEENLRESCKLRREYLVQEDLYLVRFIVT